MSAHKVLVILVLTLVVGGALAFAEFWFKIPDVFSAVLLCIFVSILLSALPLLISYVQATAKDRQLNRLATISDRPVAQTTYYATAATSLKSIQPANVLDPDYALPIISFCLVVIFGCLMVFLGGFPEVQNLFKRTTFLLGGMYALTEHPAVEMIAYQKGTLLVDSFAFLGGYIYMLGRLIERINNNDISRFPIITTSCGSWWRHSSPWCSATCSGSGFPTATCSTPPCSSLPS